MDEQVKYVCPIDACAAIGESGDGRGRLLDSSWLMKAHLKTQHRRRCALPTQVYHACADPECPVQVFAPYHLIDRHIKAVHPQLLHLAFSEEAKQERARLESQVAGQCIGEALSSCVDSEDSPDRFLFNYNCPLQGCRVSYSERDYILWHIGADHEKDWNPDPLPQRQSIAESRAGAV
ncbi:uncharacterized protein LOC129595961 [Paramacrobiotus metropolitanus]|uniref:uncharacterized protein LOC129595961 n=1 Tax=Paramacrobiotus metropolitanus TaxID=2943436 RepID=UPI00244649C4|nr:uncharacterized protein LOC129595961 [Paramacrobiotus metropolitanus]